MRSLGRSIVAPKGNHCIPSTDGLVACTDAFYDGHPTKRRLPVLAGGLLHIRARVGAPVVFIQLLDGVRKGGATEGAVGPEIYGQRVGGNDRRWTVRLPDPLRPRGAVLVVFNNGVDRFGDRMYYARIRPARGRLEIRQRTDTSTDVYEEGSVSYLRLEDARGAVVFEQAYQHRVRIRLERRLPPGRYRLTSYQRPCQGNCDRLDPPTDSCSMSFRLRDRQRRAAHIRVKPFGGCSIRF